MSDNENSVYHKRVEWLGRNFDNKSGKSDKFYEVIVTEESSSLFIETRRWGKFGAKGQTKVLHHYSRYSARNSARGQIEKKKDKGYTEPIAPLTRLASVMDDD